MLYLKETGRLLFNRRLHAAVCAHARAAGWFLVGKGEVEMLTYPYVR